MSSNGSSVQGIPQQAAEPRPALPKKTKGMTKILDSQIREAPDMATLCRALGDVQGLPKEALAPALSALAFKAVQGSGLNGHLRDAMTLGEQLLRAATTSNRGVPPEPAVTSMIRLCCAAGAREHALEVLVAAQAAGTKPKLRTLASLLQQAAEVQDWPMLERLWQELPRIGLEPQDQEFEAMLHGYRGSLDRQYAVLQQLCAMLPAPSDPPLLEAVAAVFGVSGVSGLWEANPAVAAGRQEDGLTWKVGWTSINEDGICALTRRQLSSFDLTDQELEETSCAAAKLADNQGSNRSFRSFRRWLASQDPFDVIIDGANVGFNNQNHEGGQFRYNQIDLVVRRLREDGKRIMLVLHSKWLRDDADLTVAKRKRRRLDQIGTRDDLQDGPADEDEEEEPEQYPHDPVSMEESLASPGTPLHLIRSWKEMGVLLRVPRQDCDDWYWLYAALDSARRGMRHVQVVSNDHMRDHHWRMLSARTFLQWQSRHMTRHAILGETLESEDMVVSLSPPRPYSLRAQLSRDGKAWHFPVPVIPSLAQQRLSGRPVPNKEIEAAEYRWLVAWKDDLPAPQAPALQEVRAEGSSPSSSCQRSSPEAIHLKLGRSQASQERLQGALFGFGAACIGPCHVQTRHLP
eukprot:TRINITY_DN16481_c0_g4_i1.p1 TRINITY_DN16481_c0_g4~~TRINITY_DN16481_c0_g4_i1.p1  ORF type:complete len:632 (+),score=129.39 TRINITY_DN16481_c0_g4_i1:120-2015(+)